MSHFKNKLPVASLIYKIYVQLNISYVLLTNKRVFSITKDNLKNWNTDTDRNYYLVFGYLRTNPSILCRPYCISYLNNWKSFLVSHCFSKCQRF